LGMRLEKYKFEVRTEAGEFSLAQADTRSDRKRSRSA